MDKLERPSQLVPDAAAARPPSFERLRPPILGFAIEKAAGGDLCRLVAVDDGERVLVQGSLDDCEKRLVEELKTRHGKGNANLPFATLGGKQFWGDVFIHCAWRIQENTFTGHFRLLDPGDTRRAWGTYEACRIAFEAARLRERIRPRSDRLVVLLHGMGRSKDSFRRMKAALEEDGYEVAGVNYPSTRRSVREHSQALALLLGRMEGTRTVSFVTHSLGGIVARDLLAMEGAWRKGLKVERLVMIAPPNRGSAIADTLQDWLPYQLVFGPVGQQLTPDEVARVPPPKCEFGVIAGGTGSEKGFNPLLDGDNDGIVSVSEARLPGAADFLRVKALHSFIMANEECIEATRRFLKSGRF